jgi:acetylornithine deacetylase/succinyl-diaminopimelate desuccinylase-like protein
LHDAKKRITVKGFYDDVEKVSSKERKAMNAAPYDEKQYMKDLGVSELMGEKGYTTAERTGTRPTLDVNGIWGGYTGEGSKTVLPSKAYAKISMRLVPHQSSDEITQLFQKHFEHIAPQGITVEVRPHHGGEPVLTPTHSSAYAAASRAYETTFGKKPIPVRSGGSIPIIAMFEQELGLKTILMGFGLDSDAIHSPNEHFGLFNYFKGIETIPYFYKYFSEINA